MSNLLDNLLSELKEYISTHYTGEDTFEPVERRSEPKGQEISCLEAGPIEESSVCGIVLGKISKSFCFNAKHRSVDADACLEVKADLDDLLHKKELTFSDKLNAIILEKDLDEVDVYKRANIDRRLFSKLRSRTYKPGKNTILALIISLKLDMAEARELLSYAGYSFAPNEKTDVIVSFFMEKQVYDIFFINEVLDGYGLKCLGNSLK